MRNGGFLCRVIVRVMDDRGVAGRVNDFRYEGEFYVEPGQEMVTAVNDGVDAVKGEVCTELFRDPMNGAALKLKAQLESHVQQAGDKQGTLDGVRPEEPKL